MCISSIIGSWWKLCKHIFWWFDNELGIYLMKYKYYTKYMQYSYNIRNICDECARIYAKYTWLKSHTLSSFIYTVRDDCLKWKTSIFFLQYFQHNKRGIFVENFLLFLPTNISLIKIFSMILLLHLICIFPKNSHIILPMNFVSLFIFWIPYNTFMSGVREMQLNRMAYFSTIQ